MFARIGSDTVWVIDREAGPRTLMSRASVAGNAGAPDDIGATPTIDATTPATTSITAREEVRPGEVRKFTTVFLNSFKTVQKDCNPHGPRLAGYEPVPSRSSNPTAGPDFRLRMPDF